MVNLFESQLISILIDKINNLQKKEKIEKLDYVKFPLSGSFLNPNGWDLELPLCQKVKVEKISDGYLFFPEFSTQSFKIVTNLSFLDLNDINKEYFLKYSSYKYPIMYNGHILDLDHYLIMSSKFDYGTLRIIHYAADDSYLEVELKRNFDIFVADILPNIQDLIIEFGDSIEDKVEYKVCNVLDLPARVSYYESIGFLNIELPQPPKNTTINAFNYFKSGLIYQIENLLKAENLNIKVSLDTKDVIRIYQPVLKRKILSNNDMGTTFSNGATGPMGHTVSVGAYSDYQFPDINGDFTI